MSGFLCPAEGKSAFELGDAGENHHGHPAGWACRAAAAPAPDLLGALKARLADAGLDAVTAAQGSDGTLMLAGVIPPAREPALRDVQRWFDGASGARTVLVSTVRVAAEKPPLAIQAAWTGADPYVIDGAGQKLFVGAGLPEGWSVLSIASGTVLLERGARRLAVHF